MSETKNPGGRPATNATPLTVRIAPDQLAELDDWRRKQPTIPSRPEALRQLAKIGLSVSKSNGE